MYAFFRRDVRLRILKLVHYTYVDTYNGLRNIDFEKFKNFVKSFTNHLYIQCLVQGNITQDAVIQNVQQFVKIINCEQLLPTMKLQMKVMQMPLGSHYCKLKNINKTDVNSVVTNYYQIGIASIELTVLIDLLIVSKPKSPCFTVTLRFVRIQLLCSETYRFKINAMFTYKDRILREIV